MQLVKYLMTVSAIYALIFLGVSTSGFAQDSTLVVQDSIVNTVIVEDSQNDQLDFLDVVPPLIEERKTGAYPWIFIVAVAILLIVGLIRVIALPQHKLSLVMAFSNISNQYEQIDKEATINPIIVLQAFLSAIIITTGIFVIEPFTLELSIPHDFTFFLILLLAVCLVYTFKYFMHFIVGTILQSEDLAKLMVVGMSGMLYAFTLLIFPLIISWYYVPEESIKMIILLIIVIISSVFMVWRLVKSVIIYYRYFPFAKIYIIIYLCALEITPLLIIGKLLA